MNFKSCDLYISLSHTIHIIISCQIFFISLPFFDTAICIFRYQNFHVSVSKYAFIVTEISILHIRQMLLIE
ncbi:hypothetical protein vBAbaPP1_81 [Acinetobacter phage vB_AbaM_P1]